MLAKNTKKIYSEEGSFSSTMTLTPQESLTPSAPPVTVSETLTEEVTCSAPVSPGVSERSGNGERETTPPTDTPPMNPPRPRRFSNVTLTNVRIQLRARSDPVEYSINVSVSCTTTTLSHTHSHTHTSNPNYPNTVYWYCRICRSL